MAPLCSPSPIIDNIDEKKSEWNLSDTRIIIPLADGDLLAKDPYKIVRGVNLIPEDGHNNQNGNLEQNLVVGLDKNIFEQQSTKTDFLIIQDSNLKLLSYNLDLKNQLGYPLSFVNENRSETFWENPGPKDKPKEWSQDNAVFEVKDILIYDEKIDENINLDNLKGESNITKLRENTEKEEILGEPKCEKNFQLIINYIPKCYSITPDENAENLMGNNKNNEGENIFKKAVIENDARASSNINFKQENNGNGSKIPEFKKQVILPEKSLPLKKKAKMKKTIFDSQRSLLNQEFFKNKQLEEKSSFDGIAEELESSFELRDRSINGPEKLTPNKINKRKKTPKTSLKLKKIVHGSTVQENLNDQPLKLEKVSSYTDFLGFDITKFNSIYDLVEGLRKYRMISVPVWQMLNTGLKEMNVDILKEIIKKMKEEEVKSYSPQLKAFALVVHFKQPVAFNFLAKVCKNGWPSLNVIKEWKLQLNNHQRPNFVGVQRNAENVS